jgi:hypothetical protein
MAEAKRKRLVTIRYGTHDYECVEQDVSGVMYWRAVDGLREACFPCGVDMVEDVFARAGRTFDPTKLPAGTVLDPYANFM